MKLFNAAVNGLFDLLFWPFSGLGPIWSLVVFSLLAGVLMLWIYGLVSDQDSIRVIRDRVRGNLIGIRLFGDDLGSLFRLLGRVLRDVLISFRYILVPLLVMAVPVLLIIAQLNLRYSVRPLEPGESATVKVALRDGSSIEHGFVLEAPDGVSVETPGVRVHKAEEVGQVPRLREVAWRIRAERPGNFQLVVRAGGVAVEKELRVGQRWGATSPLRASSFGDLLLYPGEPPIEQSQVVEAIEITYRRLDLSIFGWSVDWLVLFFVLSIASGFAFRKLLGVEI